MFFTKKKREKFYIMYRWKTSSVCTTWDIHRAFYNKDEMKRYFVSFIKKKEESEEYIEYKMA